MNQWSWWQRTVHWMVTGFAFALIGSSLVIFAFPVGMGMLIRGIEKTHGRGSWAALVGFGAITGTIMIRGFVSSPLCEPGTIMTLPPGAPPGAKVSCSWYPDPEAYLDMVGIFVVIGLAGAVWGMIEALRDRKARLHN